MAACRAEPGDDRDATLRLIDWFDLKRVRRAKVLVVGAGAVGNEVLKNLALLGVGHVFIMDRDVIEMANLSRSVLYRETDNGKLKAPTAALALKELNPNGDFNVYYRNGDIHTDLGEGFVRRMDVVIGCLDSMGARYTLNQLCYRVGVPWVDAGIGSLNGHVQVFRPPGVCYECGFSDQHYEDAGIRASCNPIALRALDMKRVPTTATIASLVAGIQVQECLKLLDPGRWVGGGLVGRKFRYHGEAARSDTTELVRNPGCAGHARGAFDLKSLVELPRLTHRDTLGALLREAVDRLGEAAQLQFTKEFAVRSHVCRCGEVFEIRRPVAAMRGSPPICPCGRQLIWESDMEKTHAVSLTRYPELLDVRLVDFGVPPLGIIEARGPYRKRVFLELTGDVANCMIALKGSASISSVFAARGDELSTMRAGQE